MNGYIIDIDNPSTVIPIRNDNNINKIIIKHKGKDDETIQLKEIIVKKTVNIDSITLFLLMIVTI